jgi:aldehyde:ferredoxin oxidoreductase
MKIAEIDLNNKKISYLTLKEKDMEKFIGGSGVGAKLLYEYTNHQTDPLGPENVLIFMTGPLTGTKVFSSDRFEVITKSPLTGIYAESDCGGEWGEELKKCGIDGIVIKGKSEKPVHIIIKDEEIMIKDAFNLWSKDTFEVNELLKKEIDTKARSVCIGIAGERLVKIAAIMNKGEVGRAAGRAGVGAVMGSKNLKAITVLGSKEVEIAHEKELNEFIKEITPHMIKASERLREHGTSRDVELYEKIGDLPIKNWYEGNWKEGAKKISGPTMTKDILTGRYYCGRCVIGCGREVEIKDGPYKDQKGAGPEYEAIGMFGSNCLVDDLNVIFKAQELCNKYGLDSISAGSLMSFCIEAYERDLISTKDTGGLEMTWGNGDAIIKMLKKIAYREDIGNLLGKGIVKASEEIGRNSSEFAIHVKGLDVPAHDPRAKVSLALSYATSPRGACHVAGFTHNLEYASALPDLGYPQTLDRFETKGKAKMVADMQNLMSLFDSLHLCKFTLFAGMSVEPCLKSLNLVTGWNMSKEEFLKAGERIFNLKRLYDVREGISRKDDTLPARLLMHPRGGGSGDNLPRLSEMLKDYYRLRGWDEFGIPTKEKTKDLDLEEYLTDQIN